MGLKSWVGSNDTPYFVTPVTAFAIVAGVGVLCTMLGGVLAVIVFPRRLGGGFFRSLLGLVISPISIVVAMDLFAWSRTRRRIARGRCVACDDDLRGHRDEMESDCPKACSECGPSASLT